jgi:chemotaxis protein MotB
VDNWDLGVKRSTSVIRILLDGSSIQPSRITAAGRAQYDPVNKAKTASARQQNRRIEIILTPRLDEILKLLEN